MSESAVTTRSASVAKLSPKHHEIMRFICANPAMKRRDVARHFGVTEAWLSTIVNSDCFRDELERRQVETTSDLFMGIRDQLTAVAVKSLERMDALLDLEPDLDNVRKTGDSALKALGYSQPQVAGQGPGGGATNTQNNYYVLDRSMLNRAQDRIGRTIEQVEDEPPQDFGDEPITATEEVDDEADACTPSQLSPSVGGGEGGDDFRDPQPREEPRAEDGSAESRDGLREESSSIF